MNEVVLMQDPDLHLDILPRLRDLRCEQGQGYLFHEPLSAQAVTDLLGRQVGPADA